jgi:hypothetical protein
MATQIPAEIARIAALFGGEPIAHVEKADGSIVLVLRDGRKVIYFPPPAEAPEPPASQPAPAHAAKAGKKGKSK